MRTSVLFIKFMISLAILSGINSVYALEPGFSIKAKAAILMEPITGKVLYAQDAEEKLAPASVTKVMTMLLIMEAVAADKISWDDPITTSAVAAGMGGSQVYLKEGETMTLDEMFKAIAVVSANDASTAVAEYLSGSVENFIAEMNRRGRELGLKNTYFVNETGLPAPGHYSCAEDLAWVSCELLKYPKVLEYTSIWLDSLRDGQFMLKNTNELLRVYRGADGIKTGHTSEALYCLAATAKKENLRLLSVILGAESDAVRIAESRRLLDYGFRNFQWQRLYEAQSNVGKVDVMEARNRQVAVKVGDDFGVLVERGKEDLLQTQVQVLEGLRLPIAAGGRVGTIRAFLEGKEMGQAPVFASQRIDKANFLVRGWRLVVRFFKNLF